MGAQWRRRPYEPPLWIPLVPIAFFLAARLAAFFVTGE